MVYYRPLSPWPPRSLIARLSYRPSFSSAWFSVAMETPVECACDVQRRRGAARYRTYDVMVEGPEFGH